MHSVTILGAGKIGCAIAKLLYESGDYAIRVGDTNAYALESLAFSTPVETFQLQETTVESLTSEFQGQDSVISACPYSVNTIIAQAALKAGISYFDLTEDVQTTRTIREISAEAISGQIFMPQCGLAPGFISICAHNLCEGFDEIESVKMRVGALPIYPSNRLKYNLTWSTSGLINQYCNPCEAIYQGRKVEVMPLEGLENFVLDGEEYEAFNTSGGVGTLWETLEGKVQELNYKTVRYKGHRDLMQFLLQDLGLSDRRLLLQEILEKAIPTTEQDVVIVFSSVRGWQGGRLIQRSDRRKIYHQEIAGEHWSAIQVSTAAGICAVLDLAVAGKLPTQGFVKQEQVRLEDFKTNRFGQYYFSS